MMKGILRLMILAVAGIMCSCTATKSVQSDTANENLIIYYNPETGNGDLLKAAKRYGSDVLYVYKNINGIAVTVPKGKTVPDATKYYEKVKGVLSVTRDRKIQLD